MLCAIFNPLLLKVLGKKSKLTQQPKQHMHGVVSDRHGRSCGRLQRLPVAGAYAEPHLRPTGIRYQHAAHQVTHQRLQRHAKVLHPYRVDDA